jgi:hypothetical protein
VKTCLADKLLIAIVSIFTEFWKVYKNEVSNVMDTRFIKEYSKYLPDWKELDGKMCGMKL